MKKNYNENLVAGAAIRDDKGRRISKLFEASHPKMTVGYAKNLIMPDTPTEQEFNFRQSGGGVIEDGVAVIDKVKGNSVVWNQLVQNGNFADGTTGWDFPIGTVSVSNNIATLNFEDTYTTLSRPSSVIVSGHKYYISIEVKPTSLSDLNFVFGLGGPGYFTSEGVYQAISSSLVGSTDRFTKLSKIGTFTKDSNDTQTTVIMVMKFGGEAQDIQVKNLMCIDLTQMFGAGNEPSTYEEFLQRKPKVADEYAYNEGTIVNNKVEKVATTGRNIWDEEWENGNYSIDTGNKVGPANNVRCKNFISVFASTQYYWKCGSEGVWVLEYDSNKTYLGKYTLCNNSILTTSSRTRYITFYTPRDYGSTYNHDICINLSDPAINGQYFPYEKHELDLSWVKDIKDGEGVKLFEDGMKSAGAAFDEAGKNKAVRRVGVVDLGTLNWTKALSVFYAIVENIATSSGRKDVLCAKYASMGDTDWSDKRIDKSISHTPDGNLISVRDDAYTDAASFKAAMSGVMLIYELAEPIEVEYDEKNLTYPVIAGGTEEAIASEPSTAFRADIGYGIDAVKTILDLKARVEALEGK